MAGINFRSKKVRRWIIFGSLVLVVVALSGCQTFSFYRQAVAGQYEILSREKPIDKVLADASSPPQLKERLQLVQRLRAFAAADLKLPVDGHYQKYADLHRPFVVWNVEAASEFSLEPKSWWYPLVGSLEYRGFFSQRDARDYGSRLKQQKYDVFISGVGAYSTLGWFKDPVLNTFIFQI